MTPEDKVLWEVQLRHFISEGDQGFLLFQLGPFESTDPDQASGFLEAMRGMEKLGGSFGHCLVITQGYPAEPHYVLDALRMKDYEDWLDRKMEKADEDCWNHYFEKLKEYVAEHGSADVRWLHESYQQYQLGLWCVYQRLRYRKGRLCPEHVKRLETLPGWAWGPPPRKTN